MILKMMKILSTLDSRIYEEDITKANMIEYWQKQIDKYFFKVTGELFDYYGIVPKDIKNLV